MIKVAILTASDSRNLENDHSGQLIEKVFKKQNNQILTRKVVKDDLVALQQAYLTEEMLHPDLIIINGGTGIALRDCTIQAISPLLQVKVAGFGEAFRQISFSEIGTRALASNALCGFNYYNQLTYCIPGSTNACQTALEKLILPEYQHLLFERSNVRKDLHHHAH